MAMGRDTKLFVALLLLLALAKGNNCKSCSVSDLEIRQDAVDKHGTQETQQVSTGRKLNQMPMILAVNVYNHCPCMVDNVVIWAPNGFDTYYKNGTDPSVFSKIRKHLYLLNDAGPVNTSVKTYSSAFFYYTWDSQFELQPAFLVPHC